ncbi:MAG: nickel pincer cofactor biosynthesis protein LarC [Ktedonobacterales bacterium]|nr:nickel pincer cofactor biosynthesis protein LarC [Ktedonobacterales bacterium]
MLAYLDCFSGISGDMLLGALVDAGVECEALRAGLAALPLTGWRLEAERVSDQGLSGTRVRVVREAHADAPHRRLGEIEALLAAATLPERAHTRALAIFRRLAEAEATVHGTTSAEVEFHEVGAVDAIVDIVGAMLGFELLGIDSLWCSELPLTSGRVASAHGVLPVPAPATLALLKESGAVWRPVETEGELVTPTGAAVLATLARFERPTLRVRALGYGFGQKRLPWANCLRLMLGEAATAAGGAATDDVAVSLERDTITVIESHVDNMTGEALGWLMERLLAEGALDVAYTPLQMKKNRPGTLLTLLARPADAARLAALVVRESGTLGVRMSGADRLKAQRREERIETPLGPVRVKLKLVGGQPIAVAPEYDDCRALAATLGLPIETVRERVAHAARLHFGLAG